MKRNSIFKKIRSNIIVVTIIITVIFFVVNVAIYLINNSFLINKVKEENQAFLELTTHLIDENDIGIALEYVEHYTHIHQVEIEVLDSQQNMLFSSNISHRYTYQYQINTLQGSFTIFIDNTESITVSAFERNTLYINITLFVIYIISIIFLYRQNKQSLYLIEKDIDHVLSLINSEESKIDYFHFDEFLYIYRSISDYIEEIDYLNEQKEFNMKGLAHDIKTPLTLIYNYLDKVAKGEALSTVEAKSGFDAATQINRLVEYIIESEQNDQLEDIALGTVIVSKQQEYSEILQLKDINLKYDIDTSVVVKCREKDVVRILDNMLSNAYYYSKPHSEVLIKLCKTDAVHLEIQSNPLSDIPLDTNKIFKKGYREDYQKTSPNGKGFGLYISRLLVENMGGIITVEQTQNNVKFTIKL